MIGIFGTTVQQRIAFLWIVSTFWGVFVYKVDWAGWLLLSLSVMPLLFFKETKLDKRIFLAVFLVLVAHHAMSLMNLHFFLNHTFNIDAVTFDKQAKYLVGKKLFLHIFNHDILVSGAGFPEEFTKYLHFGFGSIFYLQGLALFYLICPSTFFGQELSVFAFLLTMLVLIRLLKLLNKHIGFSEILVILIFGFLPHLLVWTSIVIREAWQLLALMLVIYFAVRFLLGNENKERDFFSLILMLMFISLLHEGFLILSLFFVIGFSVWSFILKFSIKRAMIALMIVLATIVIINLIVAHIKPGSASIRHLFKGNFFPYIESYRNGILHAGANSTYLVDTNFTSLPSAVLSCVKMWIYYLFSPWPWKIKSSGELFVMFYVWIRTCCTFCACVFLMRERNRERKLIYALLLVIYIGITFLFSLATSNYGTALRHQILSDWIIFVLSVPFICEIINVWYCRIFKFFSEKRRLSLSY